MAEMTVAEALAFVENAPEWERDPYAITGAILAAEVRRLQAERRATHPDAVALSLMAERDRFRDERDALKAAVEGLQADLAMLGAVTHDKAVATAMYLGMARTVFNRLLSTTSTADPRYPADIEAIAVSIIAERDSLRAEVERLIKERTYWQAEAHLLRAAVEAAFREGFVSAQFYCVGKFSHGTPDAAWAASTAKREAQR